MTYFMTQNKPQAPVEPPYIPVFNPVWYLHLKGITCNMFDVAPEMYH